MVWFGSFCFISYIINVPCPKCGAPHEYIYDNNGNK